MILKIKKSSLRTLRGIALCLPIFIFYFCGTASTQNSKVERISPGISVRGVGYNDYTVRHLENGISISVPKDWTLKKTIQKELKGNSYYFEKEGNGLIHGITVVVVSDKNFVFQKVLPNSPILKWSNNPELIKGFNFTDYMPFELENNVEKHQFLAAMLSLGAMYELIYEYKNGQVILATSLVSTVPLLSSEEHNIEFEQTMLILKSIRLTQ
ncbi:hypothetical protein [Leptospira adleri]|uniref:hypothetical protein n=1 Tax=Leptospira adleri TaxID=2023186 RepID=UPI00108486C1|nr:hypothetical protein [Leptospira adleri]TGM60282.1 hypothetical protein EHQ97_03690 [Leptospira adleri]